MGLAEGRAPDQLTDEKGYALASDAEIPALNTSNSARRPSRDWEGLELVFMLTRQYSALPPGSSAGADTH